MSVDENRRGLLHLVEAFVIGDVLGGGLRVARHVDEDVRGAEGDEMRTQSSDETLDHVRQDARHA